MVNYSSLGSRLLIKKNLKERFKLLRIRKKAGINMAEVEQDGITNLENGVLPKNIDLEIGAPRNVLQKKDDALVRSPEIFTQTNFPTSIPINQKNSTISNINPNLAPGTVSDTAADPSAIQDSKAPVD